MSAIGTQVYALWHGGTSYAPGDWDHHLEHFPSITAAKDAFSDRRSSNGIWNCHVPYVFQEPQATRFPTVEDDAVMELFTYHPDPEQADREPFAAIEFGPRGGVRVRSFA